MKNSAALIAAMVFSLNSQPACLCQDELLLYAKVEAFDAKGRTMVLSYDDDLNRRRETRFVIDPMVRVENIQSIAEIRAGEWLLVRYHVMAGEDIITGITADLDDIVIKDRH